MAELKSVNCQQLSIAKLLLEVGTSSVHIFASPIHDCPMGKLGVYGAIVRCNGNGMRDYIPKGFMCEFEYAKITKNSMQTLKLGDQSF